MYEPKRNRDCEELETSQVGSHSNKRVKLDSTLESALHAAIGCRRDGRGLPVPPLLSIIAEYLAPFVWRLGRIRISDALADRVCVYPAVSIEHGASLVLRAVGEDPDHAALVKLDVSTGAVQCVDCPFLPYAICADPSRPQTVFVLEKSSIYECDFAKTSFSCIANHELLYPHRTSLLCTSGGRALWLNDYRLCRISLPPISAPCWQPSIYPCAATRDTWFGIAART